jgi:chromate transporter
VLQQELVAVFLVSGAIGIVLFYQPAATARESEKKVDAVIPGLVPAATSMYQWVPLPKLFWFFFKTGLLVFGSGLVVVPFLNAYVVDEYHWLSNRAFLDAVAVGIVSPGPVVITATFVGYLNHALAGAAVATAGIFMPSLIFVLLGTPVLRRYRTNGRLQGFIRGITVAVVGVLVGTSYLVGRSTVRDPFTLILFALALLALWAPRKVPEPLLVACGAFLGYVTAALTP